MVCLGRRSTAKNNCFFPPLLISSLNNFDGFDPQYEIQAQLHIHHVVLLSRAKKGHPARRLGAQRERDFTDLRLR